MVAAGVRFPCQFLNFYTMTTLTITLDYSLDQLKAKYREHMGVTGKVTKRDISNWLGNLVESDIMDLSGEEQFDED